MTSGCHRGARRRDDLEGGGVSVSDHPQFPHPHLAQPVVGALDGEPLGLRGRDVPGEARGAQDDVDDVLPLVGLGLLLLTGEDDAGQPLVSVDAVVVLRAPGPVHVVPGHVGGAEPAHVALGATSTDHRLGLAEPGASPVQRALALPGQARSPAPQVVLDHVPARAGLVDPDPVHDPRRDALGAGGGEGVLPLLDHVQVVLGEQVVAEEDDLDEGGLAGVEVGPIEVPVGDDELDRVRDRLVGPRLDPADVERRDLVSVQGLGGGPSEPCWWPGPPGGGREAVHITSGRSAQSRTAPIRVPPESSGRCPACWSPGCSIGPRGPSGRGRTPRAARCA
jgi:hypothetical protein